MSLKQDIYNYISEGRHYDEYDDPIDVTNEIIKIFEKRIDSIEYPYNKKYHNFISIDQFVNEVKEMLKS